MASLIPNWWPKGGWSKRTWLVLAACFLAWGTVIASRWGVVRLSDGAHWSLFVGTGRLGLETYMEGAEQLELAPAAGVQCWYFTNDGDAAWPDTQNTHAWITSDSTLSWLTRTTVVIWPGAVVLTGLCAWALARERRRGRERAGACVGCGYSLVGLDACAPCPECGKAR
ncbi:MAG: hypothetical protein ACREJO_04935 [Phycisphaerales bacterium]